MEEIIQEGKTVDDALKTALQKLSTTEDKVEVEVLEEGENGFLGFIGGKDAKIKVLKTGDKHNKALEFMEKIIDRMDLNIKVKKIERKSDTEQITINLTGDNLGIVIGRRGKTLDALQYLTNLAVNNPQDNDEYLRVILDAEGYRKRREETLRDLALRLGNKAKSKQERVELEPMPPHERKIIHSTLQDDSGVQTYSEGQDPYRKVVIVAQ
ncbi:RNA-binding cell elongation regulator Jag/EloR [Acetohalobium arabaticum]|uniref:RNA-binding protein KhpB n=1 Tax=Acetohalobium arabaticum (strain ATCC 49924 / DSM 5501 / Z-7288) TaxID=574087 RepID=D9QUN0_ACEAZ|nr:RNA-binding cell elongation regulator Jag/EloR [Acetohalobium arabaticum]ADL13831.1 single-stranded nucleic acid binding R3H domain protein [Acetohalobium arabaticum DSM 5501]